MLHAYFVMNTKVRVLIILLCVIHLVCCGQALSRLCISSAIEWSCLVWLGDDLFDMIYDIFLFQTLTNVILYNWLLLLYAGEKEVGKSIDQIMCEYIDCIRYDC